MVGIIFVDTQTIKVPNIAKPLKHMRSNYPSGFELSQIIGFNLFVVISRIFTL